MRPIFKNMSISLLVAAAALALSACSNSLSTKEDTAMDLNTETPAQDAIIYDYEVRKSSIWFTTTSNGCTSAEHFALQTKNKGENEMLVSISRLKPDWCKGMTRIVDIEVPIFVPTHGRKLIVTNEVSPRPVYNKAKS